MSLSDPLEIAAFVAEAFERLGVRYILGGSLASAETSSSPFAPAVKA